MPQEADQQTQRTALAEAYRNLGRSGLIAGNSGNLSVRLGDGMLLSPTGVTPDRITPDGFVAMGLDGPADGASSEWALHAVLYRTRPDIGAVVHTHAEAATALSCLDRSLPPFHYDVLGFGGPDVRCAPYVTFGTPELAALAAEAMQGRSACLLAHHGMIATGPTLDAAMDAAARLERLCRIYLLASAAGTPRLLTPGEVAAAMTRFETYQKAAP